jgi:peptidoglycan/LPS O-acetylase OafA/YrhL
VASSARHIPSLDGLRALSFLLVFVAHAGLERFVPGGLGVTIFFFLSGFLITTLMRAEYEKNRCINFRHFWLRRALRILPPFYLVLIAATAASMILLPGSVTLEPVAAQALHYSNYWIINRGYDGLPAGTGVYWSLAVEEHFYLVFPWLYSAIQKFKMSPRNQAAVFWGLCGVVLLWRCVLVFGMHVSVDRTYMASDTRLDSILFGSALAVWKNPVLDTVEFREARWKYAYVPAAFLVVVACLAIRGDEFRETLRYSLQGAALTILFSAAIRYPGWTPFRILNLRPMVMIGLFSYSLYLLHYAVIAAVEVLLPTWHPLVQAVLSLGISLALSWLLYIYVEKPCAKLRRRLSD